MAKYGWRNNKVSLKEIEFPDKILVTDIIPNTAAVGSATILDAWDVSAGTTAKTNTDILTQPPYPLCIQTYAVAAGTAGAGDKLLIKGYNAKGYLVTEGVQIAGTAKGTYVSNNAFQHIVSITPDDALHKSTDVNIGWTQEIGLRHDLEVETDIISITYDGAYSTADAATTYTINATYDTLTLPTMADGKTVAISYLSKDKRKSQ